MNWTENMSYVDAALAVVELACCSDAKPRPRKALNSLKRSD